MKKIVSLLFIILLFSVSSCGGQRHLGSSDSFNIKNPAAESTVSQDSRSEILENTVKTSESEKQSQKESSESSISSIEEGSEENDDISNNVDNVDSEDIIYRTITVRGDEATVKCRRYTGDEFSVFYDEQLFEIAHVEEVLVTISSSARGENGAYMAYFSVSKENLSIEDMAEGLAFQSDADAEIKDGTFGAEDIPAKIVKVPYDKKTGFCSTYYIFEVNGGTRCITAAVQDEGFDELEPRLELMLSTFEIID